MRIKFSKLKLKNKLKKKHLLILMFQQTKNYVMTVCIMKKINYKKQTINVFSDGIKKAITILGK